MPGPLSVVLRTTLTESHSEKGAEPTLVFSSSMKTPTEKSNPGSYFSSSQIVTDAATAASLYTDRDRRCELFLKAGA